MHENRGRVKVKRRKELLVGSVCVKRVTVKNHADHGGLNLYQLLEPSNNSQLTKCHNTWYCEQCSAIAGASDEQRGLSSVSTATCRGVYSPCVQWSNDGPRCVVQNTCTTVELPGTECRRQFVTKFAHHWPLVVGETTHQHEI